ncbi:GTP-binding protein [Rickettsiella endosymbiont of Dermanyssus gallinae]|uniref:GTP-binding protein n=1 Tax=Rickettsiella endosymbiont of Dermanyssus gallinae TaxID=2856608 RepID=UPI002484798C|nr:GTP-binding protein [Rickettsiella endosymbiont of Dermanyssus gallinae]
MGIDFFLLKKRNIKFHLWDLAGAARFSFIRKAYYKQASSAVYVLDATKDVEENKRIFQEFNREIKSEIFIPNACQLIVFNKSDAENSKLSQDYINEFAIFNVPYVICSAKTNEGVAEIKDTNFNYVSGLVSTKEAEEELLLSEIEKYSKCLRKKHT